MLINTYEELFLYEFRRDLDIQDRNEVVKHLREAARHNYTLPADIVLKLADMIDPDKLKRRARKPIGGKNPVRDYEALRVWILASFDKELARFLVNQYKKAFQLCQGIEHISNWADLRKFTPIWKYPDMSQKRELTSYPLKDQLKDYISTSYEISERYLDMLIKKQKDRARAGWFPDWHENPETSPPPFGLWKP